MLSMVKMLLKEEVRGHALNSHGNYTVAHGKSLKNHGIVFLNFIGDPVRIVKQIQNHFVDFQTKMKKTQRHQSHQPQRSHLTQVLRNKEVSVRYIPVKRITMNPCHTEYFMYYPLVLYR